MNPITHAWVILKNDKPKWEDFEPGDGEGFEAAMKAWESTQSTPTRTETPLDWFDTFRMTRPEMAQHDKHIHDELNRRHGAFSGDREFWSQFGIEGLADDPNNPFFRHTRAEMMDARQQMATELERRGRHPLPELTTTGEQNHQRLLDAASAANEEERPPNGRHDTPERRRVVRILFGPDTEEDAHNRRERESSGSPPSVEWFGPDMEEDEENGGGTPRGDIQTLHSMLMDGQVLTPNEIRLLVDGHGELYSGGELVGKAQMSDVHIGFEEDPKREIARLKHMGISEEEAMHMYQQYIDSLGHGA
jgi:hypothetical protein